MKYSNDPEEAMKQFDREHSGEPSEHEDHGCGDPMCTGCNPSMTDQERKDAIVGEKMLIEVVVNPEDPNGNSVGTSVDLPSNKNMADLMLLAVVKTMAAASSQTPEEVIADLVENLNGNLISGQVKAR